MKKKFILFLTMSVFCFAAFANESEIIFGLENISAPVSSEFSSIKNEATPVHYRKSPPPPRPKRVQRFRNELSNTISDLIVSLWLLNNVSLTFDDYPYADGKYLNFPLEETLSDIGDEIKIQTESKEQFYRFTVETGIFYHPSMNLVGNESRFEGYIWKFFGPVLENTIFTQDLFDFQPSSFSGNLKLGGQLSILHSNYFDLSNFVQWSYIYGKSMNASGISFGFILRSYPINPILLEWRCTFQDFFVSEKLIFESHLELGLELNSPAEVYVAYKYYNDCVFSNTESNGFSCGIKYNF